MTPHQVGAAFRKMSFVAIAVIIFTIALYAIDLVFGLGWGYKPHELKLATGALVFAVTLRIIGLKIIAFVSGNGG